VRNDGRVGGQWQRKQKKRKKTGGAAEKPTVALVFGWWLCWLPVVELMVGRLVMRVVVAEGHYEEKKKREDCAETRKDGFLAHFGHDFLLPQAIKSASIYRRWKRAILSTMGKTFLPLIQLGRIPTVGSK
jgi:hypothetical protein